MEKPIHRVDDAMRLLDLNHNDWHGACIDYQIEDAPMLQISWKNRELGGPWIRRYPLSRNCACALIAQAYFYAPREDEGIWLMSAIARSWKPPIFS